MAAARRIRVMIVDDHPVMRAATRRFLDDRAGVSVVHEAESIDGALAFAPGEVDVIVLDLSMPGTSGLDGAPALKQQFPGARILMLTVYNDPAIARSATAAGIEGFITKGCAPADLVGAVLAVATHGSFVPPDLEQAMRAAPTADALSPRELEVLRLLIDGVRVSDIAEQLGISLKTASTFKSRIHAKTRCSTLDQLIGYAVKHQLLPTSLGGAPIDPTTV
ncbi:MAG: response regulator [Ilumatobacteraceae bacterium]